MNFLRVTEGTIEENLLATIAAKKDLALAALDAESEVDRVDLASGMEELKGRLEVLLGARPEAAVDESVRRASTDASRPAGDARRERVAAAGGELLGAAFKFLGELVTRQESPAPPETLVANLRAGLDACVEQDANGQPRFSVTLPDRAALHGLAQALARLLAAGGAPGRSDAPASH
jgi:hypothetical protein